MEKIRAIHEQITSNLQVRVTIEELSKQYDMPATSMKNVFQKFFNIVSGLILFNLSIAAAHFIERTFVVRGKYNINKEKIKYIDKKI